METVQLSSPNPIDKNARVCSVGSQIKVFWITATGTFQPLELPTDVECKTIKINVHDGNPNFGHVPLEFHISSDPSGHQWDWWKSGAIFSLGRTEGIICYIRAEVGNKIVVTALS